MLCSSLSEAILFPSTIIRSPYLLRLRKTPSKPSSLFLSLPSTAAAAVAAAATATATVMSVQPQNDSDLAQQSHRPDNPQTATYPTPLSPQLPLISKEIELSRAMTASSKSSLFSLSRNDVIFEDEWLIVVNKPRGIYCESVWSSVPRLLEESSDFDRLGNPARVSEFHLANRLDRDTSGLMVITKSHKVAAKLVKAFTDCKVRKTYIAHCIGLAPEWDRIRVRSGHGRSKFGAWRVYSTSDVGRTLPGGSFVRNMETAFEVLSVNGEGDFRKASEGEENEDETIVVEEKSSRAMDYMKDEILVRAFPRSGRTHQIRLHCQYLGMPIKGDVKYEGVPEWKGKICDGHELHAETLSFEHPVTGLSMMIEAPLPLWASKAIQPS
ncbi:hypothetical protein Nepgr_009564 [Nepenthes gracilis]|uniref:Pseudouridine synthase RsuA/RluA-like domain-containing protein n=1 Tax=Nepenthes gracilis TaxID=150966 RepID=A0AAD3XKG5_NEPGR|nr:hypothetical protein Nepgr_009564 [Nepenthes gracilis]